MNNVFRFDKELISSATWYYVRAYTLSIIVIEHLNI